ncbi:hypothetical protein QEZ40_003597 [Streptomyces katrae]|uniref:Uncharacterized protein n=1 Tax=Streptomyces katrae TaxID=68223 RepID=A0ABT7GXR2_9ACTN|nr:hypothetical protein [Streptomyces katrae]MDK9498415.1 hypothetical protein [Streptomyces katrae]
MPASEARAEDLDARLSDLGLTARMKQHATYMSVEAEVPETLPDATWREVLEVLTEADRFGLLVSSSTGRTLWAAIYKEADHQR